MIWGGGGRQGHSVCPDGASRSAQLEGSLSIASRVVKENETVDGRRALGWVGSSGKIILPEKPEQVGGRKFLGGRLAEI
jgi:hypothetical protein